MERSQRAPPWRDEGDMSRAGAAGGGEHQVQSHGDVDEQSQCGKWHKAPVTGEKDMREGMAGKRWEGQGTEG